jgi:DNA repair protein SbcC/Rad50
MQINALHCQPFAAIAAQTVRFKPGLNVIIGPNEAGKSTLVEALYAVLFQGTKLKKNNKSDIDFRQRAMRYPSGDHAHVHLEFETDGMIIDLVKHWQDQQHYVQLSEGDTVLREEEAVDQYLQKILLYGASTYANVFFARQHTFRESLERLKNDCDTVASVDHLLKRAVMQLDGVSVDMLRNRLEEEIQRLGKRWDLENKRPEGNRTLQNPYKSGVGEVLGSYYEKEKIRMMLTTGLRTETEIEKVCKQIEGTAQNKKTVIAQLDQYEGIEQQVIDRETVELKLSQMKSDYEKLLNINREWPMKLERFNQLKTTITKLEAKEIELSAEWQYTHKAQLLEQDRLLLARSEALSKQMKAAHDMLKQYAHVSESDLQDLEKQETIINRAQAVMEAATLIATLKRGNAVTVIPGLGERQTLSAGGHLQANGSLTIEAGDEIVVTISAGTIDFEMIRGAYENATAEKKRLLEKLQSDNVEDARALGVAANEKSNTYQNLESAYRETVKDKDLDAIRKALKEFETVTLRSLRDVTDNKDSISLELNNQKNLQSHLHKELKEWEEAYQNHDQLLDVLVDNKTAIQQHKKRLENLAALPEGFDETRSFLDHLRHLRKKKEELESTEYMQKLQLERLRDTMPEVSAEELMLSLDLAEVQFEKLVTRLNKLQIISRTLESVLKKMDTHSAKPLEDAFGGYLRLLTNNKYQGAAMDQLNVSILGHEQKSTMIPTLFSAGTYDTVALALRFALIDQFYKDKSSVLILDDCLVNLDPDRKALAISLIQLQAERHQLIFTTCHPETAASLGGHHIHL